MINHRCVKNTMAITAAALVAILFMQGSGVLFYTAMIGSALLVLTAIRSPWLGLLALFPLAFALRPAPPSAGAQEIAFAALMGVIFLSTLFKLLRAQGVRSTLRLFAAPILVGSSFLVLNLAVAMYHPVALADWIRGVVPFVFIYALIPICALLGREESDIHWLGASVGSLILLTAGYIVLYYFYHGIWQPYWVLPADGQMVRISQEEALHNAQALGPMRGRITMMVAQATDAILPLGMVVGYVVCTLTPDRRVALIGSFMSLLCMAAVLITFTRSMLISALLVIGLFALYTFFAHKRLRLKVASSIGIQTLFGLSFIFTTGMQDVWLGRMNSLAQTALPEGLISILIESKHFPKEQRDFNVSSRVEEYKIAWDMFLNHPVLGNGIGVKHEMRWERPNGDSFTESVSYIHNWPLYMLMVGGVVGMLIYAAVLAPPVLYRLTTLKAAPIYLSVIRTAVMTLAIYGLFFAVFRLISFNLLLAAAWGVMLAHKHSTQVMNIASPDGHNAPPGTVVKDIQETSV